MSRLPKAPPDPDPDVELRPDGWDRFRLAVKATAKAGPKHRKQKAKKKRKPSA